MQATAVPRTEAGAVGMWINLAILALLVVGFVLSLWSRPSPRGIEDAVADRSEVRGQ